MFYSANGKFTKKSIKEGFLDVFHGYVHKHDETELNEIKSDINDIKDKADDLSKEVKSSKRNFYGLYSKVSDFDQKFDDLDKIQDEIDQKFSYLDEVQDEIDHKFSYLDEVQDEMEQQINEMNHFQENVGIGKPPHNDYKLDVNGGINVNLKNGTDQQKNSKAINVFKNFTGVANGNYVGNISGIDHNIGETGVRFLEKGGNDIRSNQTKVLNVLSNNDSKMVVTGSGNVGIGETNPENILHVRGNGPQLLLEGKLNENAIMRFSSGPSYGDKYHEIENELYAMEGHATKNKMHFKVNNGGETNSPGTRMTVRGDGNVGIGTTSPSALLEIKKPLTNSGSFPAGNLKFSTTNGANNWDLGEIEGYVAAGTGGSTDSYPGGLAFKTKNIGAHDKSLTTKMVLDAKGNVGVGTTRPLTKLQVGSIGYIRKDHATYGTNDAVTIALPKATSNSVLNDPQDALILTRPGTSGQAWQSQAHMRLSRYENSGNNSRTRLDFALLNDSGGTNQQGGSAPDNVMTLLSNGNVGVGTTAPSSTLDVNGSFTAKSINPFEGNPSGKYYSRWSVGGVEKRIYHFVCYFKVDHRNIQTRLEIDFSMAYFRSKTGSHNRNQRAAGKVVLNIASNCPSNNGNPQSSRSDMKWFINYSSHGTHYVVSGQMGTGPGFYFLRKNDSCYILAAMGQSRSDGGSYNAMFKVSIMDPFLKEFRMFTDNATMKKNANIEPHLGQQSDPSNHKPDNYNSDFPGEYNFTNDDYGTWIKIDGEGTKYQSFDNKLTNQTLG